MTRQLLTNPQSATNVQFLRLCACRVSLGLALSLLASCSSVRPAMSRDEAEGRVPSDLHPQIEALYSHRNADQAEALQSIAARGEQAAPAIPVLLSMLGWDDGTNAQVVAVLQRIGRPAIRPLVSELICGSEYTTDTAEVVLARQGRGGVGRGSTPTDRAMRLIVECDPRWNARRLTVVSLAIGGFGDPAIDVLFTARRDVLEREKRGLIKSEHASRAQGWIAWTLQHCTDRRFGTWAEWEAWHAKRTTSSKPPAK
ncbi:MAG: hypothetical protein PHU85_04265 [Phycisphaerae bacterium]|nr:hypothetical protein [Phycisphaerae bacterium]